MPSLLAPRLDDRSYEDLRTELIRRIPVHSREWTDHNAADPGIALLELFAWLGENALYRMNRMPEKAETEFLRLLNLPPRPATVARTMVRFRLPRGDGEPLVVPFGGGHERTQVEAPGDIRFQILDEVAVLPVEARPYVKHPGPPVEELPGVEDVGHLLQDHFGVPEIPAPEPYRTEPLPPVEGGVLPPATALAATVDQRLWIALVAPEPLLPKYDPDRPETLDGLRAALAGLRRTLSGRVLSLGVRVDDELCGATDHLRCPDPGRAGPRFPLVWRVATGRFDFPTARIDRVRYDDLAVHSDGTDGLARSGVVRLMLPAAAPDGTARFGAWTGEQLEGDNPKLAGAGADLLGIGDLPPRLDAPELEARILTWVVVQRADPDDPPPRIRLIDVNMVEVEQAVTAGGELLGYGNGKPGQVVSLAHAPVLPESLLLQVKIGDDWTTWQRVDDLALSRPNDPHYELLAASGEVRFGDGIQGRIVRPGELIRSLGYQWGGGAAGNVPAEAIKRVRAKGRIARLEVVNLLAATGGRDGETKEDAKRRIPQALRHRERAVAASDFVDLALETPGVHVGRVEVLARHKPHERVNGVPGVVTLIVLPAYDALHPDEPMPDREMLRRVCLHLEPRRLVTTELYVTPPEYVPVWVSAAIEVDRDYGIETVRRWVELAIRQYLAPLPPYGPEGAGWPFGRDVRKQDVEAVVLRVEGVRLVNEVRLEGTEIGVDQSLLKVASRVRLRDWQLPVVRGVQVVAAPRAERVERIDDPAAAGPLPRPVVPARIPVPVEIEEC